MLTGAPAEALYRLYRPAFEPLKVRSAARQVLTRSEFFDQMRDDRVDKYVAWENGAEPIGMITLTRHLESVPWISPEYFAARYPEHWARNAIYYLGFILAHPRNRTARFLETIVRGCVGATGRGEGGDRVRHVRTTTSDVLGSPSASPTCCGRTPTSNRRSWTASSTTA